MRGTTSRDSIDRDKRKIHARIFDFPRRGGERTHTRIHTRITSRSRLATSSRKKTPRDTIQRGRFFLKTTEIVVVFGRQKQETRLCTSQLDSNGVSKHKPHNRVDLEEITYLVTSRRRRHKICKMVPAAGALGNISLSRVFAGAAADHHDGDRVRDDPRHHGESIP